MRSYIQKKVLASYERPEDYKYGEEEFLKRSEDYQYRLERFLENDVGSRNVSGLTQRREVIQYALAFLYITDAMVRRGKPMTEDLITRAHGVLCDNIESASGQSSIKYAAMYRQKDAFAGTMGFTKPSEIRNTMVLLMKSLNKDVAEAEGSKVRRIDLIMIVAKYCDRFVNIHPFADSNGRLCGIVLNVIFKYAGVVVAIGEKVSSKDQYLQNAMRSGQAVGHPGELATMELRSAVSALEQLKMALKDVTKQ